MSEEPIQTAEHDETLTLAFSYGAIDRLADPGTAVDTARQWSENVGVVADAPAPTVINDIRDRGVYGEDFFPQWDRSPTLAKVKRGTESGRYVYVGATDEDAEIAAERDWEYVPVEEAARAAGWALTAESAP